MDQQRKRDSVLLYWENITDNDDDPIGTNVIYPCDETGSQSVIKITTSAVF